MIIRFEEGNLRPACALELSFQPYQRRITWNVIPAITKGLKRVEAVNLMESDRIYLSKDVKNEIGF